MSEITSDLRPTVGLRTSAPEHHTNRTYNISHATTYTYEQVVTDSYGRAVLAPRATAHQQVLAFEVECTPNPQVLTEHRDVFGNRSHYLEVRTGHTQLALRQTSRIRVEWPSVDLAALNENTVASAGAWLRQAVDPVERARYLLPSPAVQLTPEVAAYAEQVLPPERPLGEALAALTTRIYADFSYTKGVTSVATTLPELLAAQHGVCQDFAHLVVGCARIMGLPARYVSGYLETSPPPGQPKLAGSDATHAWAAVMVPGAADEPDWIDLDPTNNQFPDSRYVTTGWGRDYSDVPPLRGVIFTDGTASHLEVAVDVVREDRIP